MNKDLLNIELRLDWSEMDLFGHINNVSYFKYLQASRVNCWEITGLSKLFEEKSLGPTLFSTSCKFLKPLFYPGSIKVIPRVTFIKNTSFGLSHEIYDDAGIKCAEGEDIIVFFNYKTQQKSELPGEFRQMFQELL